MERTAFVTGADRGLGYALTAGLLDKGWRVFGGQYMPEWPALDELAARADGRLEIVPLDVASGESVAAAAAQVGEHTACLDMIINSAGVLAASADRTIRQGQAFDDLLVEYEVNTLGPLRVVEALLPLTRESDMKRLVFISSEAGSINRSERKGWFGYCMSKAALNMGVGILFNRLRPEGYTFRLYYPGWMRTYMRGAKDTTADLEPEEAAVYALAYFLRDRGYDPDTPGRNDEDRLVMRDWRGMEWPW